jgi:hypothetical protein
VLQLQLELLRGLLVEELPSHPFWVQILNVESLLCEANNRNTEDKGKYAFGGFAGLAAAGAAASCGGCARWV